ncbi:MAG: RluA family pseudouridine synthase [Lachnospiraceae bacterium]|nr:RluA family pseudouridine synthase [Lachnospiraceae bacterium]
MQEIIVAPHQANQRLDKLLQKLLPGAERGFLFKMLRKKNITLNGRKAQGNEMVSLEDRIQFYFSEETFHKFGGKQDAYRAENTLRPYLEACAALKDITVIYEDHNVIICNKPSGVLSQKAKENDMSVNEWLIGYLLRTKQIDSEILASFKPSVCNRLDRNTSGLMLLGKTLSGSQHLSRWIKGRNIRKFYRLFALGKVTEPFYVRGYLTKDERTNRVSVSDKPVPGGEFIETRCTPLKVYGDISYLEVELLTGKPHQIRAHLSGLGHPLIGDYKYGRREINETFRRAFGVESQLLHAYRLEFPLIEDEDFAGLSRAVFYAPEPEVFDRIRRTYKV